MNLFKVLRLSKFFYFILSVSFLLLFASSVFAQSTDPSLDESVINSENLSVNTENNLNEAIDEKTGEESVVASNPDDDQIAPTSHSNQPQILKPDQSTGALTYAYDFNIPPGRNGLAPDLFLSHNSQRNDSSSIVGYGWELSIPYIKRLNKKGLDKIYDPNSEFFYSSLDGELVLIDSVSRKYRPKTENGDFRIYTFSNNSWSFTQKDGTVYAFGTNAQARQDNPNDSTKIYQWMLETTTNTNGNFIKYNYFKETGQIYPDNITYAGKGSDPGIFKIIFSREVRSNQIFSNSAGFSITTSKRISAIEADINNSWSKKYSFAYKNVSNNQDLLLASIIESGKDEQNGVITTKPATSFDYGNSGHSFERSSSWKPPTYKKSADNKEYYSALGGYYFSILDVNGDSLPDIIRSTGEVYNPADTQYGVFLNTGQSFERSSAWKPPTYQEDGLEYYSQMSGGSYFAMLDVNGDSLPDLIRNSSEIYNSSNTKFGVFLNTGHSFERSSAWKPPTYINSTDDKEYYSPVSCSYFAMLDVNGDGLPDLIRSTGEVYNPADTQYGVFLNTGHSFERSSSWKPPTYIKSANGLEYYSPMSGLYISMSDVNGDGLPDLIRSTSEMYDPNNIEYGVFLNTGHSFERSSAWKPPTYINPADGQESYSIVSSSTSIMSDVNGDGLPDLIRNNLNDLYNPTDVIYGVFLNTGHSFERSSAWKPPTYIKSADGKEYYSLFGGSYLSTLDVNGDGLPDLIRNADEAYNSSNTEYGVFLNDGGFEKSPSSHFLKTVTIPSGGTTSIEYKPSAQYRDASNNSLNDHLPYVIYTVSKITQTDPVNGVSSRSEYVYSGGEEFFASPSDKQFASFNKVVEDLYDNSTNVLLKKTVNYFHQGDADNFYPIKNSSGSALGESADSRAKIGKNFRTEIYDGNGNLYETDITKWDSINLTTGSDFVYPSQTVSRIWNGSSSKNTATSFSYDAYGNLIQKINWGEVNGNDDGTFSDIGSDKSTENISYVANVANYIVGLPSDDILSDQGGNKVSETKTYYDGLALGSVNLGNPTKTEKWKTGTTYVNIQKTFNSYGLPISSTDERGKTTSFAYDFHNLYPATITDLLSHVTQYLYDYSSGAPRQITDPNGNISKTIFDGLDRAIEEDIPDPSGGSNPVAKTAYAYVDVPNASSVHITNYLDSSNSFDVYQYLDGFGRIIQERKEAENPGDFNVSDTGYNSLGLVQKQSLKYTSAGSVKTSPTAMASLYTTSAYDPLGRILNSTNAVSTTSYSYNLWKTTITDANGKQKNYYKDAYGNLVKIEEFNLGNTYTTNYEWNLNKKLTKITDALSNVRNFTYDGLGRRLTAEDLHASSDTTFGTWNYVYDDAGNLTQATNPNGNVVNYSYDDLNRMQTEDYVGATGTEITYAYDSCANGIGKLCSVTMLSGVNTSYLYDKAGNISKETKAIASTNYLTSFIYDRQKNILLITYPDGNNSQVHYTYNTAGLLNQIEERESRGVFTNIVYNIDYSSMDQTLVINYANNTITTNTYDAGKLYRLSNKTTTNSSSVKFQNISYTYDPVGNITNITDTSSTNASKIVNYVYDDLNRLTSATSTNTGNSQNYTETYVYNALGNLTNKNGTAYLYQGNTGTNYANPHAPTSIGGTVYSYDKNGNLASYGNTTNTWNYKNELTKTVINNGAVVITGPVSMKTQSFNMLQSEIANVPKNSQLALAVPAALTPNPPPAPVSTPSKAMQPVSISTTITYTYDQNGQRVKYSNGSVTTYYPNKYYNYNGTKKTKQIYLGDTLVSTIETNGTTAIYYVHTDHLNSPNIITSSTGAKTELLDYYPFGNIRLDEKASSFSEQRKYIGQIFDTDTSLNYLNARYYNSTNGQFISQDPEFWATSDQWLLDPQNQNSYSYARNNPVNLSDPGGRSVYSNVKNWMKSSWNKLTGKNNTAIQNTTNANLNSNKNSYTQVLSNDKWKSQMPDRPRGCFDVSAEVAGYTPSRNNGIVTFGKNNDYPNTLPDTQKGVGTINSYMKNNQSIIVGVNRNNSSVETKNLSASTQHYVVISGYGFDNGKSYYTFFDVGTRNYISGTSQQNRLYLDTNDYTLSGQTQYDHSNYMVSEVRPE